MVSIQSVLKVTLGLLSGFSLFSSFSEAQVVYRVTELVPSTGYTQSEAISINDKGEVIGNSYPPTINWNGMATKWTASRPTPLGIVKSGTFSSAGSINSNGLMVGEGDDGRPNAVVFSKGTSTFLTKGANNSYAVFATDGGKIFGNILKGFDGRFAPVLWSPVPKKAGQYTFTELQYIDSTGIVPESYLYGANNAGQAVGYAFDSALGQVPLVWNSPTSNGKILPGPTGVLPLGMNDLGVIVGMGAGVDFNSYPALWYGAPSYQYTELSLFAGETYGYATGINNSGIIIGYHSDLPAVWIGGEIFDVNASLNASGKGWVIQTLNDINNVGVIVGSGLKNGTKRAVQLTPVP